MTLLITSTDLEQWSERNDAREHLPTLVRRLILAIAAPQSLRMPAAEGVGQPGLDGEVACPLGAPPFVPAGASVWEMGTGKDPQSKAQSDYGKRLIDVPRDQRAGLTFVFVTSRRWPDAQKWIDRRVRDGDGWAGILVIDADQLAAWLALCPGVHRWLATEQLGRDPGGLVGLRDWYRNWAERSEPAIPPALLLCGRDARVEQLLNSFGAAAGEQVVASSGQDESIAFVAAALLTAPPVDEAQQRALAEDSATPEQPAFSHELGAEQDSAATSEGADPAPASVDSTRDALLERAVVINDERAWRQICSHESPLILLPVFAEAAIGEALRAHHHVVLPRAARPEDTQLPRLHRSLARQVWAGEGIDHDRADEYARAARRSLLSLRRRLGRPGWLREPPWADGAAAGLLAPLLLAGAWVDDVEGDREALQAITERGWRTMARELSAFASGEDAPLLLRQRRWEFADPIDAWDRLTHALTAEDLDAFVEVAPAVLSETDPAAGLTRAERLAASLSEEGVPLRKYSGALRRGMATTLAILGSVAGDRELPGGATGQDLASAIVHTLLHDADAERWRTLASLLPLLAEASPEVFLRCVEQSLDPDSPPIMSLFEEAPEDTAGLGGGSAHPPLLWALETLAWSSALLSRVAVVLGRLADRDPGGRWSNRPDSSLAAALHLRLPQGAVDASSRIATLDAVRTASPQAGWNLSVSLVKQTDAGMLLVNGPRFRDWTRPAYSPSSETEEALDAVASRVAQDIGSDPERLSTAFGIIDKFGMAGRSAVLDAADQAWAALDDTQRRSVLAVVAEKVATHRRYPEAVWALPEAELLKLEGFLDRHALPGSQPDDVELFTWAPFKRGGNLDPEEPDEQALAQARAEAIGRCLEGGTAAIFALAEAAQIPATVGDALAAATDEHDEEVLGYLGESSQPLHALAAGLAMHRQRHDDNWLRQAAQDHPERAGVLCSLAPFDQALLSLVNGLPGHAQADFWRRMYPQAIPEDLTATVVRRLLDHDRPWTAIDLLSHAGNSTNISLAVDALKAPLSNSSAEGPQSALSPQYTVGRLLDRLQDAGADEATLADLEWAYQPLLEHNRTPQALHRRLARDPGRFADLVCVMYGPEVESQDEGADDPSPKERASRANAFGAAWSVLREWRAPLPGSRDGSLPTSEDLLDWVREAQDKLTAAGRSRVLPIVLGDALCGAATDEDGTWPSRPVRDLLETLLDTELEEHLFVGKLNQRGVTVRGVYDGGEQERSLAAKYREAADKVRARWPRSGALLDGLSRSYSQDARREDRSADGQADT